MKETVGTRTGTSIPPIMRAANPQPAAGLRGPRELVFSMRVCVLRKESISCALCVSELMKMAWYVRQGCE